MTGRLYIDIETTNVQGHLREVARPFMKIDSRMKDEEKIEAAYEKKLDETALNGLWGEVIAIGYVCDDDAVDSYTRDRLTEDLTEAWLLQGFGMAVSSACSNRWHKTSPCIIGHNVQFDIRFLYQRYIVNNLQVPHWLMRAMQAKPWDADKVFDTMVQWYGVKLDSKVKPPSLNALAAGLGIEVPPTIDGSEVPQAWLDGRYDEIRAHVLADVEAVRQVHYRMVPTLASSTAGD